MLYPDKKYIQCYQDEADAEQNRSLNLSNIIIEPHKEEETLEKAVEDADESNPAVDEEEEEEPE